MQKLLCCCCHCNKHCTVGKGRRKGRRVLQNVSVELTLVVSVMWSGRYKVHQSAQHSTWTSSTHTLFLQLATSVVLKNNII
jgi:hypothetical protein